MKKIITLLMFVMTVISFAEIRDDLKIFNSEEIESLNLKINEFEKRNGLKVYVVTSDYNNDFKSDRPEKTIILNIQRDSSGNQKIVDSFTRDLGLDEYQDDLNLLLDNLDDFSKKSDYKSYVEEFLFGIDDILTKNNIQVDGGKTFFDILFDSKWKIILWIILVFTFFNVISKIRREAKIRKQKIISKKFAK